MKTGSEKRKAELIAIDQAVADLDPATEAEPVICGLLADISASLRVIADTLVESKNEYDIEQTAKNLEGS